MSIPITMFPGINSTKSMEKGLGDYEKNMSSFLGGGLLVILGRKSTLLQHIVDK